MERIRVRVYPQLEAAVRAARESGVRILGMEFLRKIDRQWLTRNNDAAAATECPPLIGVNLHVEGRQEGLGYFFYLLDQAELRADVR
jgi:hypothetical protein